MKSVRSSKRAHDTLREKTLYLYQYAQSVYEQSVDRFGRIDQKASSLFSANVLVVGVVFGLGAWWISIDMSSGWAASFSIASWFLGAATLGSAVSSVTFCIRTLHVHDVAVPPLTDEVRDYVYDKDVIDSYAGAAQTLQTANEELSEKIDAKGASLSRAYVSTVVLLGSVGAAFVLAMIRSALW